MKKNLLIASLGLLTTLAACGGSQTIVRTVSVRSNDPSVIMSMMQATERVMNRRMAGLDIRNGHATVVPTGGNAGTVTLTVQDADALEKAEHILEDPFSFDIRIEQPSASKNPTETDTSEWIKTALTGSSLNWVRAIGDKTTGEVSIELSFTDEGQRILASVFKSNPSKHVGIFIRDLLVSKLKVESAGISDRVVIGGIPSATVAEIFADDVNVGLYVTFSPAP